MVRRLVRWGAALVGVVALVVAAGWGVLTYGVPHYRPGLDDGERYGIDVSAHQGSIDWAAVAGDGIGAAYVKASEGATFEDDRFAENWTGAREAGVEVGGYHFFTLCKTGEEQAANFLGRLRAVGADSTALPPVVDLELSGNCAARPPAEVIQGRLRAFVAAVEAETGQQVRLYLLGAFGQRYPLPPELADRQRWARRLLLRPAEDGWAWWQVSSRARITGIDGPVDLDVVAPG